MNKIEFLSRLRIALAPLPEDERDAAMVYYEEFFDDAGVENEQSVIAEFGSPEELARSIVDENNRDNPAYSQVNENGDNGQNNINSSSQNSGNVFNNENTAYNNGGYNANGGGIYPPPVQQNGKWSNGQIALVVVLLVLSSPIWLGVLAAILGVIVGLFGALIGIIAALGCCTLAFLIAGVLSALKEPAVGIMLIGMSFVCGGLFPLAIVPLCKLAGKGISALGKGIGKLFGKITGRKENAQ